MVAQMLYYGFVDSGESGAYSSDEEALLEGLDMALQLCGNAGQETLIARGADAHVEYGIEALESEGGDGSWDGYQERIKEAISGESGGEWQATYIIWEQAYSYIEAQFGFHDSTDEMGEGQGQ